MKIFSAINKFHCSEKTILTVGTFDGVHLGHKRILEKLKQNTFEGKYQSLVLTFFPHPRMVLRNRLDVKLLNSIDEKIDLLDKIGIQNLVIHPFDEQFSQLTAAEFVKTVLVDQFHVHKIIIGHDHRFGRNRTANIDDLISFGKLYNFEVEQISAQEIQDVSISSTKIRNALIEGNIPLTNRYLGYNYFLTGIVCKGQQLGRTIGFPTANIFIEDNLKLIPKNGVYIVKSVINHITVFGLMNIGFNPTISGKKLSIEVYYFDFESNLYDQKIIVSLLQYLREEQKFTSLEELKIQLKNDEKTAIQLISKNYK